MEKGKKLIRLGWILLIAGVILLIRLFIVGAITNGGIGRDYGQSMGKVIIAITVIGAVLLFIGYKKRGEAQLESTLSDDSQQHNICPVCKTQLSEGCEVCPKCKTKI